MFFERKYEDEYRSDLLVQVTHNPDVECYADRLLYLEDGKFVKQAINRVSILV